MFKVLIVDDEPIVSVTIKSLIQWEEYNITMMHEAFNGKQALKILEENPDIDIVITDINMPIMDGLALIEHINNSKLSPAIIVLSAYGEYNLIRNAFKLGVSDYILKTEIDANNLLSLLKSVITKLQQKKTDAESMRSHLKSEHDLKFLRERFLNDLISKDVLEISNYNLQNIKLSSENLMVCFLWIDDFHNIQERYANTSIMPFIDLVLESCMQVLIQLSYGEIISLSTEEYAIILSFPEKESIVIMSEVDVILKDIKYNLSHFINIHVSIGVSGINNGFDSIRELFVQAEKNARFRFVFGKQKIIYPEDVIRIDLKENLSIIPRTDNFIEALKMADETVVIELETLLDYIGSFKYAIDKIVMYYSEIIFIIIKTITDMGEEVQKVFGKDINFYEQITRFETGEEINIWIRNLVSWVLEFIKDKKDIKLNFAITKAITFIKDNFQDENISTIRVCNYVGLSENHFSVLFKQEAGETFINYLTNLRIEKAKKLMETTNMKVYEICDCIGYRNVEHFSRTFKKVTGSSPNYYKNHYVL